MEFSMTKRRATDADTDTARRIHHEAYHDVIIRQFGSWDEKLQDRFFDEDWNPSAFEVILIGDEVCGYSRVAREPDYMFIYELVLSPAVQNRGIGTNILEGVIKEARQNNVPIRLHVFKENRAQELYRKLGFRDLGSTGERVEMELRPSQTPGITI